MAEVNEISELKAENRRLRAELEKATEKVRSAGESSAGVLLMLEDLERSHDEITRGKKEWEATFDAISDPLFIHDREMRLVRVNRAYLTASGEAKFKHIIGKPYYEVFPKMEKPFKMCQTALELQEEEEEFPCPVTNRIFKVRFYPIKDVNGGYLYSIHIIEDITEAKRSAERYKMIVQTAMEGFWLIDTQGRMLDVNDALCKMLGYTRDEMLTKFIPDFEVVESPEETAQHIRRIIEKGWDRFESRHRCKDGRIIDIDASVYYMKVDDGRFFAFTRDITERKETEKRIKDEMEITSHLLMIAEATAHTTDMDKLMEQAVHCGREIMKCDVCLSYIYDKEAKTFRPSQQYGLLHDMVPLFMTEPLDEKIEFVRKVVEGKEPLVISQPLNLSTSVFSWLPGINTVAVIPLFGMEGPLGIIIGVYKKEVSITDRDEKIMQGISHEVSIALEQARLYKESVDKTLELSHKIETIKVMNQIDRSILSTLKADELLETVTRLISKVIPCERATVSLVDMERGGLIYKAGFGTAVVPKGAFVPFADTSARGIVETGRAEYIGNISEIRPLLLLEKRLLDEGFLSHIRVPITIKGDVAGVLTVGAKRVAAFTKENLSTLEYLCSQIGVALSNAGLISDLEELVIGVVKSLSSAIDAKSPWTAGHSERVTKYALDIAKEMGLAKEDIKALELAGLLHDIGKIGTYDILLDKPGKLEPDEMEIVRQHAVKGATILEPIRRLKNIIPTIRHHHEFYDGRGYPDRLKGEEIPFHARILAVADTFDAMKADRPYRPGRTMEFMVGELKRCSGTQFDPKVVEAFLKVIGETEEFKMAAS